jgi:outer membrane protein OmpA-like peptidoglycan-associated protein
MARFRASEDDHYAANVWPAVTDSILLMASIFIVLAVVSMMSMAQKFYDYEEPSQGESQTVCFQVSLPADKLLFKEGDSELLDEGKAAIKSVLTLLVPQVNKIKKYAEGQGWGEYYIILEASGHTDDQPLLRNGRLDGNWALAAERAHAVVDLIERVLKNEPGKWNGLGVRNQAVSGSTVLRVSGYSSHLPMAPFANVKGPALKDARTANRRVEIRLFAQPVDMVQARSKR